MAPTARIGLNLLYLVPGETGGTETYARMLIPAIHALRPDLELVAFIGRGGISADDVRAMGANPIELPMPSTGRLFRVLGEQSILPLAARKHKVDLLHNFAMTAPFFSPAPQITSTHDVIYASHPDAHSKLMHLGQSVLVPMGARRAKKVVTLSEASAREIVRVTGIERSRILVVPIAARTPGPPAEEQDMRTRLGLGDTPFVLATSARRGHKNLGRLLEAMAQLKHKPAPSLVLPGYATGAETELQEQIAALGLTERVHLLGWIDDADMDGLYAAAELLAFPSLAEGFGLPVLEAMTLGVPVVVSNRGSLPEVVGDAGAIVDANDPQALADAIERVLRDEAYASACVSKGLARSREYRWDRAAERTYAVYQQAVARRCASA
jgi:glycosyltransferase involved in cell wall biosynthesis